MVSGDERDSLILVIPQRRNADDHAPVSVWGWLGNNDPEVRSDARARGRNQKGVAAAHPRVSTTPYKRLNYSKTLNLTLKVCNLRVGPIRGSEDIAVRDGDRAPVRILPLRKIVREFY